MRATCRFQGECCFSVEVKFASPRQILLRDCTWKYNLTWAIFQIVATCLISDHVAGIIFGASYPEFETFSPWWLKSASFFVLVCVRVRVVHSCVQDLDWRMMCRHSRLCAICLANVCVFETRQGVKGCVWNTSRRRRESVTTSQCLSRMQVSVRLWICWASHVNTQLLLMGIRLQRESEHWAHPSR